MRGNRKRETHRQDTEGQDRMDQEVRRQDTKGQDGTEQEMRRQGTGRQDKRKQGWLERKICQRVAQGRECPPWHLSGRHIWTAC